MLLFGFTYCGAESLEVEPSWVETIVSQAIASQAIAGQTIAGQPSLVELLAV